MKDEFLKRFWLFSAINIKYPGKSIKWHREIFSKFCKKKNLNFKILDTKRG